MTKLVSMLRGATMPAEGVVAVERGRVFTRADSRAAVAGCMNLLREQGVRPGQRVVALLDHDARGMLFLAAASGLGLRVVMPYNLASAAHPEWATIAEHARPDHVVTLRTDADAAVAAGWATDSVVALEDFESGTHCGDGAEGDECLEPVQNFLVLFTSGSSGSPKAVGISEALICRRIATVSARLNFHSRARVFMSGLMTNTTGVIFSFGAAYRGSAVIFPATRDPARWPADVAARRGTHIMLRPGAMRKFVDEARASSVDLSSLEVMAYGGAPMPRGLLEDGRRLLPCEWIQGYGLSETYGPFCWLDEQGHAEGRFRRSVYCVGVPDETVEVTLQPLEGHPAVVGEVAVRSGAIMDGYYDVATGRVTAPAEWFRTGDVGEWSPDGDLLLKGRVTDSVLSDDGHRIYPEEVETALCSISGVDEAALVGMPQGDGIAETPVACIRGTLSSSAPGTVGQSVAGALAGVLSREKWPAFVYPTTLPFPRNVNDKIVRAELVARIESAALIPLAAHDQRTEAR